MHSSEKICLDSPLSILKPLSDVNNIACVQVSSKPVNLELDKNIKLRDLNSLKSSRFLGPANKNVSTKDKTKKKVNKYFCAVCLKHCKSEPLLKMHFAKKSHEIPSKCSVCSEVCSSLEHLTKHSLFHSKNLDRPGESFKKEKKIVNCKNSHEKENSFSCSFCSRSFVRLKSLETHMKIHTKEAFICKFCEKNFLLKSRLIKHLQTIHYMLDEDQDIKDSVSEKNLEKHVAKSQSIAGENKHVNNSIPLHSKVNVAGSDSCILCDKIFPTTYQLGLHLMEHAEEYEKSCEHSSICDYDSDIEIIEYENIQKKT